MEKYIFAPGQTYELGEIGNVNNNCFHEQIYNHGWWQKMSHPILFS